MTPIESQKLEKSVQECRKAVCVSCEKRESEVGLRGKMDLGHYQLIVAYIISESRQ